MKFSFSSFKRLIFYFAFFFVNIVFSEFVVRFATLGFKSGFPIFMILFSVSIAFLLSIICSIFKKSVGKILSFVFSSLLIIIFSTQVVYHQFADTFLSVTQIGADLGGNYGNAFFFLIAENLIPLILLFVPVISLIFLHKIKLFESDGLPIPVFLIGILIFFVIHFITVIFVPISSAANVYNENFDVCESEKHFGVLTTLRIEIREILFDSGYKTPSLNIRDENIDVLNQTVENTDLSHPIKEEDVDFVFGYNITDIDFDKLIAEETNKKALDLHKYFQVQTATKKNPYTGMYEDYNFIFIIAESFSYHVIDKDRTPTLYKLSTQGFQFNDYYNVISDNTCNGEYTMMSGLLPDTRLLAVGWNTFYYNNSFTKSKNNYLPFCFGNQFNKVGKESYAFHYYSYNFYRRFLTHPNLGYNFFAMNKGLVSDGNYPTSDLTMMKQALPKFLKKNEDGTISPFHAYFLTFSGHLPYYFESNDMAAKNQAVTKNLPYSIRVKAYIAAQQELENALTYLLDELEKAGVLDNTVICLTNDHYPYNLGIKKLSELAGYELDELYDKHRSKLILWNSKMTAPVNVDVPCCSLDIIPTISNLFGLEYDSRLLMGKDILAEGDHIAIFFDKSFVTDKVMYNAKTKKVTLREGVTEIPEGYIEKYIKIVEDKFNASENMIYCDYYKKVYKNAE